MTVPAWAQETIYYQIFPDRFANGDRSNDPVNVRRWGSPPDAVHFQGGDLRGIIQRLDYLIDLGVESIYLNPIFLSSSNHRYNTIDYYQIDPKLGTLADFTELVDVLHARGICLILDGVFNHCGRGFFAFVDLLENGRDSPYLDWFHVLRFPLEAYAKGETRNYQAWWGIKSLPKFNTANPKVREYIYGVARYWIERGADGWRLDVPNEIDDDEFWAGFRDNVKRVNSEAVLIGEIWEVQPRWLDDRHFDSLMNYPLRTAILDFLQWGKNGAQTAEVISRIYSAYPWENTLALYNPLGSHDTERVKTVLSGRQNALRLAFLLQFALPGAPAIYYGDEIGLEGGKDPDCRRAFPWDENQWDRDLRDWVKALIQARKSQPALRLGRLEVVYASDHAPLMAFKRVLEGERILAVANGSDQFQRVQFQLGDSVAPSEAEMTDLLGQPISARIKQGLLTADLPPYSGAFFKIG